MSLTIKRIGIRSDKKRSAVVILRNQKITYAKNQIIYTNPGFRLPSLKSTWNLVYPGENCDDRTILRNLIGCLENSELEKTVSHGKSKPRISV